MRAICLRSFLVSPTLAPRSLAWRKRRSKFDWIVSWSVSARWVSSRLRRSADLGSLFATVLTSDARPSGHEAALEGHLVRDAGHARLGGVLGQPAHLEEDGA